METKSIWKTSFTTDFWPSRMFFVDFNIQVTSFLENATSHEYVWLHAHSKLISPSTLVQLQLLSSPLDIIKSVLESLKGTVCLVRILDDEWLCKTIIKLSDELWKRMKISPLMDQLSQCDTYWELGWLVSWYVQCVLPLFQLEWVGRDAASPGW